MAAQIHINKANLSNKVLLSFSHLLKYTRYNLWGECLDLKSESLKSSYPLSSLFAVLRNSLILLHQWCSTEKSRPLHCQPLRGPVLFDSVFCGSLDTPPSSFFPTPPHTLSLFASSIIPLTRFRVFLGCLEGVVGWREIEKWLEGRIGKFVISLSLAASQGELKSHGTIWSLQTIKLLVSPLIYLPHLSSSLSFA